MYSLFYQISGGGGALKKWPLDSHKMKVVIIFAFSKNNRIISTILIMIVKWNHWNVNKGFIFYYIIRPHSSTIIYYTRLHEYHTTLILLYMCTLCILFIYIINWLLISRNWSINWIVYGLILISLLACSVLLALSFRGL